MKKTDKQKLKEVRVQLRISKMQSESHAVRANRMECYRDLAMRIYDCMVSCSKNNKTLNNEYWLGEFKKVFK